MMRRLKTPLMCLVAFILALHSSCWAKASAPGLQALTDGKANAAPAIQAAIDKVGKAGGVVSIPVGNFMLLPAPGSACGKFGEDSGKDKTPFALSVPSNVTLEGAGNGATIFRVKLAAGPYAAICVRGERTKVRNLAVLCDRKPKNLNSTWGVVLNGASRAVVEGCRFEQLSAGVLQNGASDCRVSMCEAKNCYGSGAVMYSSTRCTVERSVIDGCGDGNCIIYGANNNCQIVGCSLLNADQCGVIEGSKDCAIRDCTVDGGKTGYMGLVVNRSIRATIQGNTLKNLHHGIYVRETDIAGAGGIPCIGTKVLDNTVTGIRNRNPGNPQTPIFIAWGYGTLVSGNLLHDNQTGAEILVSSGSLPNTSQANCIVSNNQFLLAHAEYGEGFFAESHPCIVSDVGVTVTGNSITSYGPRPFSGLAAYLIDVGSNSLVTNNRNGGLPGLAGGVDRFIHTGANSIITGNITSWHELSGPVIEAGANSIVTGNHLSGALKAGIEVIPERESSLIKDNVVGK